MIRIHQFRGQRGAALILTVIIIMVLTTLGLSMVAFSTTEERTAASYRDGLQARSTAEAGVRVVQEMFRDPTNRLLVPLYSGTVADCGAGTADYCGTTTATTEASLNALGIWRKPRTGASPAYYTGFNNKFFLGPFRDSWSQTFGGTYNTNFASDLYDVKFDCTNPDSSSSTAVTACWLDNKINSLLATSSDWNLSTGKITDISFYSPPINSGTAYGIAIVRVTAVKIDSRGNVLARETVQALIGDNNQSPSILGNGDVSVGTPGNINACGNGCEQIFANGDLTFSGSSSGGNLVLSSTGSVNGTASNKPAIVAPMVNPWDLAYKPQTSAGLAKYYLLAARPLDLVWTNGLANDNPAPRTCGLALCQDYNLEYATDDSVKTARSATGTAYMYKWNSAANEWTLVTSSTSTLTDSTSGISFGVSRGDDTTVAGGADTAALPFNKNRVPTFTFSLNTALTGATILVDGKFDKSGSGDFTMSIIAVGSASFHGDTNIAPALQNKVGVIAGRDIKTHSSYDNDLHNVCNSGSPVTLTGSQKAKIDIIAAHEQIDMSSQTSMAGVIIAENRVHLDPTVENGNLAINGASGDHVSQCGDPDWPWSRPTIPIVLSLESVPD